MRSTWPSYCFQSFVNDLKVAKFYGTSEAPADSKDGVLETVKRERAAVHRSAFEPLFAQILELPLSMSSNNEGDGSVDAFLFARGGGGIIIKKGGTRGAEKVESG